MANDTPRDSKSQQSNQNKTARGKRPTRRSEHQRYVLPCLQSSEVKFACGCRSPALIASATEGKDPCPLGRPFGCPQVFGDVRLKA